jgi:hypothetical protein
MDKLISDADLSRFNGFLKGPTGGTYHAIDDSLPSIEELFPDHVYYAILFKTVPNSVVGHWVCLIRFSDTRFEFFDCLGDPPPSVVLDRLREYGLLQGIAPVLQRNSRSLMSKTGTICGKWVMFRLLSLPNSLEKFNTFIKTIVGKRKGLSADAIVNFLINIPVGEKSSH